jgi:hypothetical protein
MSIEQWQKYAIYATRKNFPQNGENGDYIPQALKNLILIFQTKTNTGQFSAIAHQEGISNLRETRS